MGYMLKTYGMTPRKPNFTYVLFAFQFVGLPRVVNTKGHDRFGGGATTTVILRIVCAQTTNTRRFMRISEALWNCQGSAATSILFIDLLMHISAVKGPPSMLATVMTLINHRFVRLLLRYQVLSKFCATFVDRHGVSDHASSASSSIWEFAALHPSILECRYAVDGVE